MKYLILLPVQIEADPADFGGAARKGFEAIGEYFNDPKPMKIHILPLDGEVEAEMAAKILNSSFTATTTPEIV